MAPGGTEKENIHRFCRAPWASGADPGRAPCGGRETVDVLFSVGELARAAPSCQPGYVNTGTFREALAGDFVSSTVSTPLS